VIRTLDSALSKARFARMVADAHELEALSPGEFVSEILNDIEDATAVLHSLQQAYPCRPPASPPGCEQARSTV